MMLPMVNKDFEQHDNMSRSVLLPRRAGRS